MRKTQANSPLMRLLVKQFDTRHLLAALGRLDAVSDQNAAAVDAYGARE